MVEPVKSKLLTSSRRIFLLGAAATAWSSGVVKSARGQPAHFQANGPSHAPGWQILPIGAGGFLTGLSISNDGTMVIRTDTYGGYVWSSSAISPIGTSGSWQQIVTYGSMPVNYNSLAYGNIGPVWEVQVASSDSNIMYMVYNDVSAVYPNKYTVYKSTNKGQTWSASAFTPLNFYPDYNSGHKAGGTLDVKAWGPKLAIDPVNPNLLYVGTGQNGLFITTNGGSSWNNVSSASVPYAAEYGSSGYYPGYTISIGIYNGTQYVVAFSYGNGIYLTSNGGSSWSKINIGTGPATAQTWSYDPNTGYFYCIDASGNAWQYTASAGTPAWTKIYSGAAHDISCDPKNANHIVITNGNGQLAESTNGTSFGRFTRLPRKQPAVAGDVTWMSLFNGCNAHRICCSPIDGIRCTE